MLLVVSGDINSNMREGLLLKLSARKHNFIYSIPHLQTAKIKIMGTDSARSSTSASASYYNLGSHHRPIKTSSPDAQRWFDRGLIWTYAFNHEEASRCFRRAIASDPDCSIAYWGLAYSLGPNYNKPWQSFDDEDLDKSLVEACRTSRRAKDMADKASPSEKCLIEAIQYRYPERLEGDFSIWNSEYASAMKNAYRKFPNDLDVSALYADALMNLTPWKLWDLRTGQPAPEAHTLEIRDVLEHALALEGGLRHPGILHMYIHLMEMSGKPESALSVADNLRGLVPDAGHLNHMPTHLDVLCGEYRQAIISNTQAIRADEKFLSNVGPLNFYTLYRAHNYHFRLYAAMFTGQSRVALDTVTELEASIPEELLRVESPPMADWLEGFLGMRVHALIRFGRWEDILALQLPHDQELYCMTTALLHYAKGVANAALSRIENAEKEQALFKRAVDNINPSRTIFNNTCLDIVKIAEAMLNGEVEYRKGDIEQAFNHLREAIALDEALPYDEPWGWMQPPRHAYGALLLEQGRDEEALEAYAADLGISGAVPRAMQHPNNVWSLHGLYECLLKLERKDEARILKKQLDLALAVADVDIKASCFCRLETGAECGCR